MKTGRCLSSQLVLLGVLTVGCGPVGDPTAAAEGALAQTPEDAGLEVSKEGNLVIATEALGKRVYLVAATAIYPSWNTDECGPKPTGYKAEPPGDVPDTCFYKIFPLATRRVTFIENSGKLLMKEKDTEVARFDIAKQGNGTREFAFNPAAVHFKAAIKSSAPELDPTVEGASVETRKLGGWISVRQDGELVLGKLRLPGRIKYGISLARESKTFKPAYQGEKAPKYFYEISDAKHAIAKFDFTDKQVVKFRNVGLPPDKRAAGDKALAASIDYWNRVFQAASGDKKRVFIALDPGTEKGVFSHDPGFNVVQWMTYEGNAASTGVFQTDANGATLFANAHISAGFFGAASDTAKAFYDHVNHQAAPAAAVDRFVADYLFETVAHEMGHTLGLQHDFEASNLAKGRTPSELTGIAQAYFAKGDVPADLSASVLEYLPLPLAGMLGGRMRKTVLPHDLAAIARGYFGKEVDLAAVYGAEFGGKAQALAYCNNDSQPAESCAMFDHPLCEVAGECWSEPK